jgi:SAM-dependent methyltransferase
LPDLTSHLALLSEPVRVRLLSVLEAEELGVGEITRVLQLPQSSVSRHLKDLRVAGWIRRRTEGTGAWFSLHRTDLADDVAALWTLVRDDHRRSHQATEDAVRLRAVLDARTDDGRSFFARMRGQWDALRRELFGDAYLLPTLICGLDPELTVADLGCGTGEVLSLLAPVVGRVIGVDREQAMLDTAADRTGDLPNVELRRGGIEELPLADGEVDLAFAMLVLHHVPAIDRAFGEIARALRPGGRCVVLDMIAHDRTEYRQTMGHQHLGFAEGAVQETAAEAGLSVVGWRALPPTAEASGPPLFLATLRRAHG